MIPDLVALDGAALPQEALANKVVLFVNVASQCGLTPQYAGLQALADSRAEAGFLVVGVPCNQFGGQEPGTADEIASFCESMYGVTFPLLEKQDVNGPDRSPLYQVLVGEGPDIQWNFEKFLVGRDGAVVGRFSPMIRPDDADLAAAIEAALWSPDASTES